MIEMIEIQHQAIASGDDLAIHPLDNPNGSVTVLVLMVLAIMTVIGIVSSDTVVTENFIIRNAAIHRQNVSLVESALMEGLQRFMQMDNNVVGNFDPILPNDWINADAGVFDNAPGIPGWYETNFNGRVLDATNSMDANTMPLLAVRGENLNGNLRIALVGWGPVFGGSILANQVNMHGGRCVAEYVSMDAGGNDNGFGLLRMEIGLRRMW